MNKRLKNGLRKKEHGYGWPNRVAMFLKPGASGGVGLFNKSLPEQLEGLVTGCKLCGS